MLGCQRWAWLWAAKTKQVARLEWNELEVVKRNVFSCVALTQWKWISHCLMYRTAPMNIQMYNCRTCTNDLFQACTHSHNLTINNKQVKLAWIVLRSDSLGRLEDAEPFILMTPFGLESISHDSSLNETLSVMNETDLGRFPIRIGIRPKSLRESSTARPQLVLNSGAVNLQANKSNYIFRSNLFNFEVIYLISK